MSNPNRRDFINVCVGGGAAAVLGSSSVNMLNAAESQNSNQSKQEKKENNMSNMKIVVAADPFALKLGDAIIEHLKSKGYDVVNVGATAEKSIPYFDSAQIACKMLQDKKADRAILICGTGMGMSIIANKFHGVTAACVESIFAAQMCRAINNANALCLGGMIWGDYMALQAVDAFLTTNITDGLPEFADFLKMAEKKVEAIDNENRK
ncbi:MAG: RpiB/LacA/LacB family sugar-phosphate isomerase [Thermoguttaceae bacterium]